MRTMECETCGCVKSLHNRSKGYCNGCWEIWRDNHKEFTATGIEIWHKFKLNNLKWLEQQYEKTL